MHRRLSGIARGAKLATALFTVVLLAACESDAAPTGPGGSTGGGTINEIVTSSPINATSTDTLVAFNLATNSVVPRSGDWDILVRRYVIRVNGTATGGAASKNVTAYAMNNNRARTDAEVLAFTPANTLAAFDAVRASAIPADSAFKADRLEENTYAYLILGGTPRPALTNYWKVKTSTGGYAVVRATALTFTAQNALASITLESRLQTGSTLGAVQTLTVPFAGAVRNVSLVSNAAVPANGCNWDLAIDPSTFEVTTNAACNVGTYPGGSAPTFANATTASDAPQYARFLSELSGPIPNSFTDLGAPFRYDLAGDRRLNPAYNIYLVKVGTRVYKMQVINYYNESGASGYLTIRSARIQ